MAQVWALHVGGEADNLIATGGADAKVTVWRDVTSEEAGKKAAEAAVGVQQQQALANALQVGLLRAGCLASGLNTVHVLAWVQHGFALPTRGFWRLLAIAYSSLAPILSYKLAKVQASPLASVLDWQASARSFQAGYCLRVD